jgi:hypothetical protein
MRPAPPPAVERRQGLWLPQRTVDLAAHRGRDSGRVSGALSSLPCVEAPPPLGLELTGAGAAAHPTPRASRCAVETPQMARDKQKPAGSTPTWHSWMRVAFCSSPRVAAPGRRWGRPQSSPITINMTASRHWPPSPCRPSASTWGSTCAFRPIMSKRSTWRTSSGRYCAVCAGMSSCCGTAAACIGGPPSRRSAGLTRGCISKSSRRMPRSSTRRNSSGTTGKGIWPTAYCRISWPCAVAWMRMLVGCGAPRQNCAP